MSSHREAPETAKDPVADNTDVYVFRSPDRPDTVTIIANFIPLQQPDGGPNFYEFGDDVAYDINISNDRNADIDIRYRFQFRTEIRNKKTFLYNTGPITDIRSKAWNRPQFYTITRTEGRRTRRLAAHLPVPPVNVGPRSTPNYAKLGAQGVHTVGARRVFAGQRADAFHVDLGSVFDLGGLRPFNQAHLISMPNMNGVNAVQSYNVHTIAIQVPISEVSRHGNVPTNVGSGSSVIGVWASASRRKSRIYSDKQGRYVGHGPWEQVSRLGMPLVNELLNPMAEKNQWNHRQPKTDHRYAQYVNHPELAKLLPVLYPGVFPRLAAYTKKRADLNAIVLTGIPPGIVAGFQNYTGTTESDMIRLNLAIPPSQNPNPIGLVAGDAAGFPNGRRIGDDVVAIELKAIAGATIPLVDKSFTPDDTAAKLNDGTSNTNNALLSSFPYLGLPGGGYQAVPGSSPAA